VREALRVVASLAAVPRPSPGKGLGTPARSSTRTIGEPRGRTSEHRRARPIKQQAGINRLTTSRRGQWVLAAARRQLFGLTVRVLHGEGHYEHKRTGSMMQTGRRGLPDPTEHDRGRRTILARTPTRRLARIPSPRPWRGRDARRHQLTALGSCSTRLPAPDGGRQEAKKQCADREYPDMVIACCGGGSTSPASPSRSSPTGSGKERTTCSAAEPSSCPTLTKGVFAYDWATRSAHADDEDYTLGHDFVRPASTPVVCAISDSVLVSTLQGRPWRRRGDPAARDLRAGYCSPDECIIPPESTHANRCTIRERGVARDGEPKTLLFHLSARHFDMARTTATSVASSRTYAYPRGDQGVARASPEGRRAESSLRRAARLTAGRALFFPSSGRVMLPSGVPTCRMQRYRQRRSRLRWLRPLASRRLDRRGGLRQLTRTLRALPGLQEADFEHIHQPIDQYLLRLLDALRAATRASACSRSGRASEAGPVLPTAASASCAWSHHDITGLSDARQPYQQTRWCCSPPRSAAPGRVVNALSGNPALHRELSVAGSAPCRRPTPDHELSTGSARQRVARCCCASCATATSACELFSREDMGRCWHHHRDGERTIAESSPEPARRDQRRTGSCWTSPTCSASPRTERSRCPALRDFNARGRPERLSRSRRPPGPARGL